MRAVTTHRRLRLLDRRAALSALDRVAPEAVVEQRAAPPRRGRGPRPPASDGARPRRPGAARGARSRSVHAHHRVGRDPRPDGRRRRPPSPRRAERPARRCSRRRSAARGPVGRDSWLIMRVSGAGSSRAWGSCLASGPRSARMKRPKAASAGSPGSRSRIVAQQLVLEGLKPPVDEVLLGGEVVEHRLLGHLGRPGRSPPP